MSKKLVACTLALGLTFSKPGQADPDTFYAFDGTTRQQMVVQAGLTNAQIYGAVAAVDRVLMPKGRFDTSRLGGEFNWIWGVAQVPGCVGPDCVNGYRLQTVDLTASNFAASLCSGSEDDDLRFCGFYAAAMTTTLASKEGERVTDNIFFGLVGRAAGPIAPLMLGAGGSEYRDGLTSVQTSAILGVNVSHPWLSGRVGYLGATGDRGLYTDIGIDKIKAFATAALTEEFQELGALLVGVRKLGSEVEDAPGMLTAYVRNLRQVPPQALAPNTTGLPDPGDQLGSYRLITAHLKPENLAGLVDLDTAYMFQPTPAFFNGIASIHTPGFHRTAQQDASESSGGLALGAGVVRLPELPGFGLRQSTNVHFHVEAGGSVGTFDSKMRLQINDPEQLAVFPFARNSWSFYYFLTVGEL